MGLDVGARLGPYEILGGAGAGGMGEVYKARDTRLNRTVAIKILPPVWAHDPVMQQRFEREAKTIAGLNHPHICTLHDVGHEPSPDGEAPALDFLVMEYLEGQTLAQRLELGELAVGEALKIAIAIADALDKAPKQGVVHRDLKPSNFQYEMPREVVTTVALDLPHSGGDYHTYAVHPKQPDRFLVYAFVVPDALATGTFPGPDPGATLVVAMNWASSLPR
jgi:hypothetical protein